MDPDSLEIEENSFICITNSLISIKDMLLQHKKFVHFRNGRLVNDDTEEGIDFHHDTENSVDDGDGEYSSTENSINLGINHWSIFILIYFQVV